MKNNFVITALPAEPFKEYFHWPATKLSAQGMSLIQADAFPGYPCRVSLEDAQIGEDVLLVNYTHHQIDGAYRSNGPIFIRKDAFKAQLSPGEIPQIIKHRRNLSLRCYSGGGNMIDCRICHGDQVAPVLNELFEDQNIAYIHIHNAAPGCFNCEVKRAQELC